MPAAEHFFSHKELLRALLKDQDIREGFWQLSIKFGFGAANIGPNAEAVNPAGMVTIEGIGIRRVEERKDSITLDAAEEKI